MGDITSLLWQWRNGDQAAEQELFALVMPVLRRLARYLFIAIQGLEEILPAGSAKIALSLTVDRLLSQLADSKPEWCQVVEVKYFLGLTDEEAAETLGIKMRTLQRMWRDARRWLFEHAQTAPAADASRKHAGSSAGR